MPLNTHANLISIFAFVIAGFQLLLVVFFGLYVLMTGGIAIAMALDPKVNEPGAPIMMGIFAVMFGVFCLLGLAAAISNFVLGRRLRQINPPTPRFVIIASIVNIAAFFFGGMFSTALGVYGLWFALSDEGKFYFSGQGALPGQGYAPYDVGYARDPNRVNWR